MVIKNVKKIECLSVSYNYAMTICKPCLEKSSNDSNKIYQLCARIPYNSYFRKYLKLWYQWLHQGRHISWGSTSANLDALSYQLFQKSSTTVLFWVRRIFFRIDKKNCSCWVVQKILSKKVRRVLQRRGGGTRVAMELQKKPKWTIAKTLLQTFWR